ncbi:MAG TPA: hypothetical protein VE981_15800 [Planctomycetota bacterium]|nr:hypothetical protein [Planctomycetota bacterium]
MHATLAPAKTYYLQFHPTYGFFTPGAGLDPVAATPGNCAGLDRTLKDLSPRELVPEQGVSWMERHRAKEAKKVEYWEGEGREGGRSCTPRTDAERESRRLRGAAGNFL